MKGGFPTAQKTAKIKAEQPQGIGRAQPYRHLSDFAMKRFSLQTLLIVTTVVSFALAVWVDRHNSGNIHQCEIIISGGTATVVAE
jgi:hypothetical protein